MGKRRRAADVNAELDALYATLPTIDCKGLCWDSCGRIGMSKAEHRRIVGEHGVDIPDGTKSAQPALCVALTILRRCSVYEIRPLICRLWGLIESLPCTFGCRPERYLTDAEAYELLAQAHDISGDHAEAARVREPWSTPEKAAESARLLKESRREREIDYELRERRALASGTAVYVDGPGRLTPRRGGGRG